MAYQHEGKGRKRGRALLAKAGYSNGGHLSSKEVTKEIVDAAVHKHEKHDHKGEKLTKLKDGGMCAGGKSGGRLDKYARGGSVKKRTGEPKINIIIGQPAQGGGADDMVKAAMLAKAAGPKPPMPMPGPGPAMPPPGPMPGGPMKRGGRAVGEMTAGAGSGVGREEKAENAEKRRGRGR